MKKNEGDFSYGEGFQDGIPILLGYFSTAIAFGLICRNVGIPFFETCLYSFTNFAGAGQFLAVNLFASGALLFEYFIGINLINLRYLFMGVALRTHLAPGVKGIKKMIVAFGVTDEIFTVASMKNSDCISFDYMAGLISSSYLGWNLGTAVGFMMGMILPKALQMAVGVTLYAMFSSLLSVEFKNKGPKVLIIAGFSAAINSFLIIVLSFPSGWSFVISMVSTAVIGALLIKEEK
ncbi:MAG: AzlC family ABC transporter permease [Sphaerochaetaceae bacterium]